MSLLCIQIFGTRLRNQQLSVPLSPSSDLIWLGLSDLGSPVIMDSEDIIKIYDKKSSLWKVVCDMNCQVKDNEIIYIFFFHLFTKSNIF